MHTLNDSRLETASKNNAELHGSVSILLPAFTNGTLDSEEQQILARHLAHCSQCYQELRSISGIRETMCADDGMLRPNTEVSFGKLMGMIESEKHRQVPLLQRIQQWLAEQWYAMAFSFRGAVALQLLFVALLSLAWLDADEKINTGYYTLSDPEPVNSAAGAETVITTGVIFDGNTPIVAIQDALAEVDAKIVSGPNTMGMYRINVATSIEETQDWIKRLRESRKAVFAEITDTQHTRHL